MTGLSGFGRRASCFGRRNFRRNLHFFVGWDAKWILNRPSFVEKLIWVFNSYVITVMRENLSLHLQWMHVLNVGVVTLGTLWRCQVPKPSCFPLPCEGAQETHRKGSLIKSQRESWCFEKEENCLLPLTGNWTAISRCYIPCSIYYTVFLI
jgi:hypothetical protein